MSNEITQPDETMKADAMSAHAVKDVRSLRHGFSAWGASALTIVGARPLLAFATMGYLTVFSGPGSWLAFPVLLVLLLLVASVFGELAARWPLEGSVYAWTRQLIGPRTGFIVGWVYAVSCLLFMVALTYFDSQRAFFVLGLDAPSHLQAALVTAVLLLVAVILNASKRSFFSVFSTACAAISVVGCLVFGTVLLGHQHQPVSVLFQPISGSGLSWEWLTGPFLVSLAWSSTVAMRGFEMPAEVSEEVRNPRRNIPRSMLWSLLAMGLVFTYVAIAFTLSVPDVASLVNATAKNPYVASTLPTIEQTLGGGPTRLLAALIWLTTFAGATVFQLAASRTLWTMARDRELPGHAWLSRLTQGERLPSNVIVVTGVVGAALAFLVSGRTALVLGGAAGAAVFLAFLVPVFALGRARLRGVWQPGPWSLGRWGGLATALAVPVLAGLSLNNAWPRTQIYGSGNAWLPLLILAVILVSGLLLCRWAFRDGGVHTRHYCHVERDTNVPIRLAHSGTCTVCHEPLAAGDAALWNPDNHAVVCVPCDEKI